MTDRPKEWYERVIPAATLGVLSGALAGCMNSIPGGLEAGKHINDFLQVDHLTLRYAIDFVVIAAWPFAGAVSGGAVGAVIGSMYHGAVQGIHRLCTKKTTYQNDSS